MTIQEPEDTGGGPKPRRSAHGRDSFGPQGSELIRELRRIEGLLGRDVSGIRANRKPAEGQRAAETTAAACPASTGAARATQRTDRRGEPPADSITNIVELPMGRLGRTRRRPDEAIASESVAASLHSAAQLDRAATSPRALADSLTRAARICLRQTSATYAFLIGGTAGTDRAQYAQIGPDLCGHLRHGFEAELRTGLRVLVLGVGLAGGWAVAVPLSAAVTVAGTLVVETDVKKIQHPVGGVIAQIPAHDGMRVKVGDLLVRLDETQARTNRQVISNQLDQIRARMARLTAERDGTDEPKLPEDQPTAGPESERLFSSERALFRARFGARQNQKQLLQSNIAQLGEEITGLEAQIKSKAAQLTLISSELTGVQTLYDKQLVPLTRLTALQRQAAQLDGERSQLTSAIAETRAKISQAQLQIVKIDQDLRSEVMKDLRESQDKESELSQRVVAAQDQLDRIEIRAPTAGVVHQLAVHTIGGVISAGQVIMEIVPDADGLQIEAKLSPVDIDQVRVGQTALVRFSAFNQRTTPQVGGVVSYVAADLTQEPQTRNAYYTVRVTLPGEELRRLGNLQLVSGMPAEVFLQTGSRTMMSYLLKPITDQLQRTFSER
jgi:HlyD family secretion protein